MARFIFKLAIPLIIAMLLLPNPVTGLINSVNLSVGGEFEIEITDYVAYIEVNGTTTDIFYYLPVSNNLAVRFNGKLKVDGLEDDDNRKLSLVKVSGLIDDQSINGETYVNEWYYFTNDSLHSAATNILDLPDKGFDTTLPDPIKIILNEKNEPPPLFATTDDDFYLSLENDFSRGVDNLLADVESKTQTLVANYDQNNKNYDFDFNLFFSEIGEIKGQGWTLSGTVIGNVKIDIEKSLVTKYYLSEIFTYQIGDAWWKMVIEFGFEKYTVEARVTFPFDYVLGTIVLVLPVIYYYRRNKTYTNI